jgi:hypothetical protein
LFVSDAHSSNRSGQRMTLGQNHFQTGRITNHLHLSVSKT